MAPIGTFAQTFQLQERDLSRSLIGDLLVDIIALDGRMIWQNDLQAEQLGTYDRDIAGYDAGVFYTAESEAEIRQLLRSRSHPDHASTLELTMVGVGGRLIRTLARARFMTVSGETVLRLAKTDYGPVGNQHRRLEGDVRMLTAMLETSNEAHWSIAFLEPVDTTLPIAEVVQQVFENQSVWRLCNPAMARLYQLPETVDFNEQDVRLYWPRSEANEQFVAEIIRSDYRINDALSVDRRHDGTLQYILNDVRAEIVDGFLLRLWGNCRDVTEQHVTDMAAAGLLRFAGGMLGGLPDPVVVLDRRGRIVCRNAAFAALAERLGDLEPALAAFATRDPLAAAGWQAVQLESLAGNPASLDIHGGKISAPDGEDWTILTLRHGSDNAVGDAGNRSEGR